MKKYLLDLKVTENDRLHPNYCLLKLTSENLLPEMLPGQFVEVRVDGSPSTFLRRPISVNYVDKESNELWLLIQLIGDGTRKIAEYRKGDTMNLVLPLGNGFSIPESFQTNNKFLLVGGGVGTAPLLFLGSCLKSLGYEPIFLLGGRSKIDVLQLDNFSKFGKVYVTTEDGSLGEKGLSLHGIPYFMAPREQTHVGAFVWLGEKSKQKIKFHLRHFPTLIASA